MQSNDIDLGSILEACELSESQDTVTFVEGSVIFREGDRGDCAYIVESGEVQILRNGDREPYEIARLGPGDLLGEMAPVDDQQRSASAVAAVETRLTPIPRQSIDAMIDEADPMLRLLVRLLMQRLRDQAKGRKAGEGTHVDDEQPPDVKAALQDVREQALERVRTRREISDALLRRELVLHFQPIVDIERWEPRGYEALVRWAHPERGLISPGGFIDSAEKSGLINPIGQWCVRSACELLQALAASSTFVSVNVSPEQIRTLDAVERLIGIVHDSGVDPSRVKIEITEHLLVDNPDVATHGLKRVKDAGMTVAIDDFGTGYSSLSYLHRFPLDTLKLDRSFVIGLADSEQRLAVVEAIVRLAERLSMDVVAEGIERVEELRILEALGVSLVQGYLLGRPMSAERLRGWTVKLDRTSALGAPAPRDRLHVA